MLWLWDFCPSGEVPLEYRVAYAHVRVVATTPGVDENGGLVIMPIYSAWDETPVQEGPEQQAEVPCEPDKGELCAVRVTSLDEWGMEDEGECR